MQTTSERLFFFVFVLEHTRFISGRIAATWCMHIEAVCITLFISVSSNSFPSLGSTISSTLLFSRSGFAYIYENHSSLILFDYEMENALQFIFIFLVKALQKVFKIITHITILCLLAVSTARRPVMISKSNTPNANTSVFSSTIPCIKYSGARYLVRTTKGTKLYV